VVATRLIRVTGDCLRAAFLLDRFVDDFREAVGRALDFVAPFLFAPRAVFAELPPDARFDPVAVVRRALLPDDFFAVAILVPRGRYEATPAQDSRALMNLTATLERKVAV